MGLSIDREKIINGLNCCCHTDGSNCAKCPYDNTDSDCTALMSMDVLALLKEQETHDTRKSRIFQCEKCGYGIDDIFLNDESNYPITPVYCPNCGRLVKCDE